MVYDRNKAHPQRPVITSAFVAQVLSGELRHRRSSLGQSSSYVLGKAFFVPNCSTVALPYDGDEWNLDEIVKFIYCPSYHSLAQELFLTQRVFLCGCFIFVVNVEGDQLYPFHRPPTSTAQGKGFKSAEPLLTNSCHLLHTGGLVNSTIFHPPFNIFYSTLKHNMFRG